MHVYLEIGKKRTFAGALDWPGWCRSGKDEAAALQTLFDYAPRYARAIAPAGLGRAPAGLGFQPPQALSAFNVVERLPGSAGTDFGAPSAAPARDAEPTGEGDLLRFQSLLQAVWGAFDAAVQAAAGRELQKGPRGGGRELEQIVRHVLEAERAYLSRLGGKFKPDSQHANPWQLFPPLRRATLEALVASARGELPPVGPRGGKRWTARFFVRYAAWHLLDHTWEIEDRLLQPPASARPGSFPA